MKVLIQHNFITGLGDMYTSITQYLDYVNKLNNIGYECELIVSFRENKYSDIFEFSEIFNMDVFNVFKKISYIKKPILDKNYLGLEYVYTSNLHDLRPGQQEWDVFISPKNINEKYPNYSPYHLLVNNYYPNITPKFNDEIYKKEKLFLNKINSDYNFFHIRMNDGKLLNDDDYTMLNNFYKKIIDTKEIFHIGSNNQQVIKFFKNLKNIIVYDFKIKNEYDNDYGYFLSQTMTREDSIDRIKNNITEMVSIKNAKKIYQYSEISWISNFLFYGMLEKKENLIFYRVNREFENINYK